MEIKYYDSPGVIPGREVSADEARNLNTSAKAYFADNGDLERTELYGQGRLLKVTYADVDDQENTKTSHLKNYKDTPFAIWETLEKVRDYVWEFVRVFDAKGELTGFGKALSDGNGLQLIEIDIDENHNVVQITKYYWESDDLRYALEYDGKGALYSIFDALYGDSERFADIKNHLPDAKFYENGFALPKELEDLAIPPDPQ